MTRSRQSSSTWRGIRLVVRSVFTQLGLLGTALFMIFIDSAVDVAEKNSDDKKWAMFVESENDSTKFQQSL